MQVKRILLTGDDGYNSIGTRLLIHALKDIYQLQIAATKTQQSGVGGRMSLATGGTWGETEVDGVPALWVDGSPADMMECAQGYFAQPFDLLISGVNLGANVTTAIVSSGTYSAAVRGMGVGIAPRALVISWDAAPSLMLHAHGEADDLTEFLAYPGGILRPLIEQVLNDNLYGVPLLNINLPKQPTREIRFTKILKDITQYYHYPIALDRANQTFSYAQGYVDSQVTNLRYDAAALTQGFISVTPCAFDMTHYTTFEQLERRSITL